MGAMGARGALGAIGALGALVVSCTAPESSAPSAQSAPIEPTTSQIAPIGESSVAPTGGQIAPSTAARFDSARAWKHLEAQVSFGPRPSGSAAIQKTRDYLLAELKKAGLDPRQQVFIARTPLGEISMPRN